MSKALRFLQITVEHHDCPFFTVFVTMKTSSQNISITLYILRLNFTNIEAAIGGKSYRERFAVQGNTAASKIGNGVISLL